MHLLRPLAAAIAVLALSAAASAAHSMPSASADGLATAAQASGRTVAAGHLVVHKDLDENQANQDAVSQTESQCIAPDTAEVPTDATHGSVVCGVAQAATPDGYANHGAYVSETARDNHGAGASQAAKANASDKAASGAATADAAGSNAAHASGKDQSGSHRP